MPLYSIPAAFASNNNNKPAPNPDQFLPLAEDYAPADRPQRREVAHWAQAAQQLQNVAAPRAGYTWTELIVKAQNHWQAVQPLLSSLEHFARKQINIDKSVSRGRPEQRRLYISTTRATLKAINVVRLMFEKHLTQTVQANYNVPTRTTYNYYSMLGGLDKTIDDFEKKLKERANLSYSELERQAADEARLTREYEELYRGLPLAARAQRIKERIAGIDPRYLLNKKRTDFEWIEMFSKPGPWRQRLVKALYDDHGSILRGLVSWDHSSGELYMSRQSAKLIKSRHERNIQFLKNTWIAPQDGNPDNGRTVFDCRDTSIANPVNYKHECSIRAIAFAMLIEQREYAASFLTLTLPSRFHPRVVTQIIKLKDGSERYITKPNPRYDDKLCPSDGDKDLKAKWTAVRKKADNAGIKFLFVRSTELHKDGTPHMHAVVACAPNKLEILEEFFREIFWQEDTPYENGAAERRVRVDRPRNIGSVAGYVLENIFYTTKGAALGEGGEIDALRMTGAHQVEFSDDGVGLYRFLRSINNPFLVPFALLPAWNYSHGFNLPGDQNLVYNKRRVQAEYTKDKNGNLVIREVRDLNEVSTTNGEHYFAFLNEYLKYKDNIQIIGEDYPDPETGEIKYRRARHLALKTGLGQEIRHLDAATCQTLDPEISPVARLLKMAREAGPHPDDDTNDAPPNEPGECDGLEQLPCGMWIDQEYDFETGETKIYAAGSAEIRHIKNQVFAQCEKRSDFLRLTAKLARQLKETVLDFKSAMRAGHSVTERKDEQVAIPTRIIQDIHDMVRSNGLAVAQAAAHVVGKEFNNIAQTLDLSAAAGQFQIQGQARLRRVALELENLIVGGLKPPLDPPPDPVLA